MSQATLDVLSLRREPMSNRHLFAAVTLLLAAAAALLAGWAPLGFSIVTVFLFAGPHNWIEFRYFLSRMPARWGRLRRLLPLLLRRYSSADRFLRRPALVGLRLVLGRSALADHSGDLEHALSRLARHPDPDAQPPEAYRDWFWTWPIAFLLLAATWLWPMQWSFGMVYLHPLIALWILDRELRRSRPELRGVYHCCLACLPLFLGLLWWHLADASSLPGDDFLSQAITQHAGAGFLGHLNSHLLVSTHTFLEMLHYGVWVLAIPLVGMKTAPWKIESIPMTWRSRIWKFALGGALVLSGVVVLLLWGFFLADYPTTR